MLSVLRTNAYAQRSLLSPAKLKKIRVVHVLDSHERRKEAKEYILVGRFRGAGVYPAKRWQVYESHW